MSNRREREMRKTIALLLPLLLVLLVNAPATDAWDAEGHYMVCRIAQNLLGEDALLAVLDLLPDSAEGNLASLCSWADDVRKIYKWSSSLHFVNTPDVCYFNSSRDCQDYYGKEGTCIVGAIHNYTRQLESYGTSTIAYNLTESLLFLSHFLGDIHQPLHCGFLSDLGGNRIPVSWYASKTNLHKVWDLSIILPALDKFYNNTLATMIEAIEGSIQEKWSAEIADWEACSSKTSACPEKYASESTRLACEFAYKGVTINSTLGYKYFSSSDPVVEKRIAQGGVRLAQVLNKIFNKGNGTNNNLRSAA